MAEVETISHREFREIIRSKPSRIHANRLLIVHDYCIAHPGVLAIEYRKQGRGIIEVKRGSGKVRCFYVGNNRQQDPGYNVCILFHDIVNACGHEKVGAIGKELAAMLQLTNAEAARRLQEVRDKDTYAMIDLGKDVNSPAEFENFFDRFIALVDVITGLEPQKGKVR